MVGLSMVRLNRIRLTPARWSTLVGAGLLWAAAALSPDFARAAGTASEATATSEGVGQKASDFVRQKHDELQAAMKTAKDPKTDPKLLAVFETMLDYDALSRDSLDSEWNALNDAQRAEFSALLKQLVQKSYRKNLRDPSDYAVQYSGTASHVHGTLVKTLAQSKTNKREKALSINYVVSHSEQGFKIRDVITDDVSLVANYRSQFKRMFKKRGFEGLVEQMRKQLDK